MIRTPHRSPPSRAFFMILACATFAGCGDNGAEPGGSDAGGGTHTASTGGDNPGGGSDHGSGAGTGAALGLGGDPQTGTGAATGTGGDSGGTGGDGVGTGGDGTGGTVVFDPPDKPQWTVDNLADLRAAIVQSNQEIVMKEGDYILTDLPEGARDLIFSGSSNTVDLVGVYIEVPVGSTLQQSYLDVSGSDNTIIGGIFEDTYTTGLVDVTDYYSYNKDGANLAYGLRGNPVMRIGGNDNLVDGIKLTVRGSFPYGYGSMFGIGAGNTYGLNKRCGIFLNGQNNTLDHVEIQQRAFCHGIFTQPPADNTTVRNSLVEGVVRLGAELYDEPADSLPGKMGYMLPDPDNMKVPGPDPIPKDVMFSLSEDGLRAYTGGGSWTVENCTVRRMRGGIRLYLASSATVTNSVAEDCGETNFNLPSGATVTASSGNFAYAPLNDNRLSRSNQSLELTILPSPHATGPHNIADILGNNQDLVFHRTPGPEDSDETRAIVVSGSNSTILNETEYRIIVTGSGNNITSAGEVTNNGSGNTVTAIPLAL